MKVLLRIVAGLLATVVFCLAALWGATQFPAVQEFLAREASQVVGPEVHFDRVGVVFWPGLGVSLFGVRIAKDDSTDSSEALNADQISLILDVPSLLSGEIQLLEVSFSGAHLALRRAPDGTLSFSDIVGRFAATAEEEAEAASVVSPGRLPGIEGKSSSFRFIDVLSDGSTREVFFDDVFVDIESSWPGEDADFEAEVVLGGGRIAFQGTIHRNRGDSSVLAGPMQAELKGTSLPASTILYYLLPGDAPQSVEGELDLTARLDGIVLADFQGSGQLHLAPGAGFEWIGFEMKAPLNFDLDFEVQKGEFLMPTGTLSAAAVKWKGLEASDLSLKMQYESEKLRFSEATLGLYGGKLDYDGSLRFDERVSYQGKVKAEDVSMTDLLTDLTGSVPEVGFDTLEAGFDFEGSYVGEEDPLRTTRGRGHMRLTGGVIPSASVIGVVGGGLLSIVPSALRPSGPGRLVDPTRIEFLEQDFELAEGTLRISNVEFVTRDYTMTGHGSIGLDGHLDLSTELDFTVVGMQKLLVTTAVPVPKTGLDILPPFPIFVTGTISSPVFLPDVKNLPFMALQVFFSPVRGAARALFGGIRGAGSHLANWISPSS